MMPSQQVETDTGPDKAECTVTLPTAPNTVGGEPKRNEIWNVRNQKLVCECKEPEASVKL